MLQLDQMFKKKSVRRKLYVYLTFWTSYSDFWQVLESFTINRPWGSMWELQATDTWYTVKEPTTYWNFPLLFFPFKISLLTKNSLLAFLEINERSKCCQTVSNIGRFWYFKSPFIIALFRLQTALTFQWRLPHSSLNLLKISLLSLFVFHGPWSRSPCPQNYMYRRDNPNKIIVFY